MNNTLTVTVSPYNADNTGATEASNAILSCWADCRAQKKWMYLPAGTYKCNAINSGLIMNLNIAGMNGLGMYGDFDQDGPKTKILTTVDTPCCQVELSAGTAVAGFTVAGISFENTHGKITGVTQAIFVTGEASNNIQDLVIENCHFQGYSMAILIQGVTGCKIANNYFYAPQGHDNAQQNSQPAICGPQFGDNENGQCYAVEIVGNTAIGSPDTLPAGVPRPMDGFIYGTFYGGKIHGNTIRNMSEELIFLSPPSTNPATTAVVDIYENKLDCSLPEGCKNDDDSPHKVNYGIRADISHVRIYENNIRSATWGIMVRGVDYPGFTLSDVHIYKNTLEMANDPTRYTYQKGIFVQGNASQIAGLTVTDNEVLQIDEDPVELLAAVSPVNVRNSYKPFN